VCRSSFAVLERLTLTLCQYHFVLFNSIVLDHEQIVFLTFWQGVCIAIFVQLHHQQQQTTSTSSTSSRSVEEQAMEIQNVLLCLEMLFFSLAHFCVFPAEEWDPQYHERRLQELEEEHHDDDDNEIAGDKNTNILDASARPRPQQQRRRRRQLRGGGSPSLGLGDFASDVGYILSSRRRKRRQQQQLSQHDDDEIDAHDNDNTVSTLKTKSSEECAENDEEENIRDNDRIEEEEVLGFSIDVEEGTHAASASTPTSTVASSSSSVAAAAAPTHQDDSHREII
jgi:Organic solute transporter Ostalpha